MCECQYGYSRLHLSENKKKGFDYPYGETGREQTSYKPHPVQAYRPNSHSGPSQHHPEFQQQQGRMPPQFPENQGRVFQQYSGQQGRMYTQYQEPERRMPPQFPEHQGRMPQQYPEQQGDMPPQFPEYQGRMPQQYPEQQGGMHPQFSEPQAKGKMIDIIPPTDDNLDSERFIEMMMVMDEEIYYTLVRRYIRSDPQRMIHLLGTFSDNMQIISTKFLEPQGIGEKCVAAFWYVGGPKTVRLPLRIDNFQLRTGWNKFQTSQIINLFQDLDLRWYSMMFDYFKKFVWDDPFELPESHWTRHVNRTFETQNTPLRSRKST